MYCNTRYAFIFYNTEAVSALDILMKTSRMLSQRSLPTSIANPNNNKQKLRNDFIAFLASKDLKWRADEVDSNGESFVKAVVDTLWYIDGQHHVFEERSCSIPNVFKSSTGYNKPEISKHRKRDRESMSSTYLRVYADALFGCLQGVYWDQSTWKQLKPDVQQLARSLSKYADYLLAQTCAMKRVHLSPHPVRQISENLAFCNLPVCAAVSPCLSQPDSMLKEKSTFAFVAVEDLCPSEPHKKYAFIQKLKGTGLSIPSVLLTYSHGNNIGSIHFVWKVLGEDLSASVQTIEKAKEMIPVYHTRAMKATLASKFVRVSPNMKPVVLCALYQEITNDASAPNNIHEAEIDERMRMILEMEDPDIMLDLRHLNSGRKSQYDVFWSECKKFLDEEVGLLVDDRRHGTVTHLAKAISVRDLREQVKARCPDGTLIPSESWIRLQFWPKSQHA